MKVGFIGTGRMGQAMVRRLLEAKHEVGVYNRTPEKAKPLADAGAKIVRLDRRRRALWRRRLHHAGRRHRAGRRRVPAGRLLDALPKGGIHVCAGTHGIPVIRKIKEAHADKGQILVAAPDDGPARARHRRHRRRVRLRSRRRDGQMQAAVRRASAASTFEAGDDPEAATAMKIANNFVLGCAIEAMGEGFALTRKYGVDTPRVLRRDDRRPVQLLGLQGLRQDHGGRELRARSARWRCWA